MRCAESVCQRRAEVSIHCDDGVIVVACFSCGIGLARELAGRMMLLDATRRELMIRPKEA